MSAQDSSSRDDEEALLFVPSTPTKHGRISGERYRSQVTRNGNTSMEVEVPRRGITNGERCSLIPILVIVFGAVIGGIVPSVFMFEAFGAIGFLPLISVVVPAFIIVITLLTVKSLAFVHINLKITSDSYSLTRTGITWKSFLQILCLRSHYNDLESGHFVETDPKESHYVRHAVLHAEIVIAGNENDSAWQDIKLGSINFAHGFRYEELVWMTHQINCFLRDTC